MLAWVIVCGWAVRLVLWEGSYFGRICLDMVLLLAHWRYGIALRKRTPAARYGAFGSLSGAVLDGIWIAAVLLASDSIGLVRGRPFITPGL